MDEEHNEEIAAMTRVNAAAEAEKTRVGGGMYMGINQEQEEAIMGKDRGRQEVAVATEESGSHAMSGMTGNPVDMAIHAGLRTMEAVQVVGRMRIGQIGGGSRTGQKRREGQGVGVAVRRHKEEMRSRERE
jgi:hypothetical protein